MSSIILHRARTVFPVAAEPIADGAVAVRDGRIIAVGTHDDVTAELGDEVAARHEWEGALAPGLVNAHTHLQYTDMAEVGRGSYPSFETWALAFEKGYRTEHDWAASAADGVRQSIESGTTAVAEIVTDPAAGSAVHDAGLHGVVFWEVFGWKRSAWAQDGPERVLAELAALPSPPATGLSPHAIYSLDTDVFRSLQHLAEQHGVRLHIHAAESASEDEFARFGTGPLADRWRGLGHSDMQLLSGNGSGRGVVHYLDTVGVLTPHSHLAHGIYVDADDRALLRERGVSVALCPRSNAVIGLDAPPIADYLREGNPIGVGTDSLSSSPSLNVLDDVAELHRLARAQGYTGDDLHARLLHAATAGGARALGLDIGSTPSGTLATGHRADLAVFAVSASAPRDALAELVENAPSALTTIVGGRPLWTAAPLRTASVDGALA
ncbi:amidohydrolase family protein [Microbacterium saperdae]|uniref:Cytosine/adenosine deaminase-related metal-dependent hydrolase n=1 Tax=Microbacterium saperdae TaxID=69368 RepID=A0A543BBK7_9MICO|nr:amidohydrolase family protein [Microbacterium saperdae]TQL82235.1 cytosine/adenosine deaminase-related metal-dependent hydrolase [Microbacterium saperdae]GGM38219.1 cytosine deaminase [Microbacterium saperdae]